MTQTRVALLALGILALGLGTVQAADQPAPPAGQTQTQAPQNGQPGSGAVKNAVPAPRTFDPEKVKQLGLGTQAQAKEQLQIQRQTAQYKEGIRKSRIRLYVGSIIFLGVMILLILLGAGIAYWTWGRKQGAGKR